MNKIQQLASNVNINKQVEFRAALDKYGVSAGTAWTLWTYGATSKNSYFIVRALEHVLLKHADEFLNDPENLLPEKQI